MNTILFFLLNKQKKTDSTFEKILLKRKALFKQSSIFSVELFDAPFLDIQNIFSVYPNIHHYKVHL